VFSAYSKGFSSCDSFVILNDLEDLKSSWIHFGSYIRTEKAFGPPKVGFEALIK